jgi:excinuclease ABC subunit B
MVTTLTKRMAEELTKYLDKMNVRCRYIHSDVDTLERIEIMDGLRKGLFDVLVGVNLLREGLDLPEVSLVAILDADKEGFLRSARSLTQTAGRAARNINGHVIMYGDKITDSMKATIEETERHRKIQIQYNKDHNITPRQIKKDNNLILAKAEENTQTIKTSKQKEEEYEIKFLSVRDLENLVKQTKVEMEKAAKKLDFITAAQLRDQMFEYQAALEGRKPVK